ncbi:MAG: hypothetical protein ABWY06_13965 [Pseudomonas sp.]|uniref:hypothetical protein n=1 Tax=Pseudomonas sp. TaxID=306 RepID=UPI003390BAD6
MNAEQQRRRQQLAFAASGAELQVGSADDCPLPVEQLAATDGSQPYVRQCLENGLTAHVYRIEAGGRHWTLKRARSPCRVQNPDGQTSFLNEVQRRAELQALKQRAELAEPLGAIVETRYASFRRGLLLSPWIEGEPVQDWNEARLLDLFDTLEVLLRHGLFEWDLCPGNLLDDGRIRLFDFGYMYRFDPLRDFNSNGTATPQRHGVERFETRCYFAHLLQLEQRAGLDASLEALRLEKQVALQTYQRLRCHLTAAGASAQVQDWLTGIIRGWQGALRDDLEGLYLREAWRSHQSDLMDDLDGQTCTALTLQRIDWLQRTLQEQSAELRRRGLVSGDPQRLLATLYQAREQAQRWQLGIPL